MFTTAGEIAPPQAAADADLSGPSTPKEEAWSVQTQLYLELTLRGLCFQTLLINLYGLSIPGKKKNLGIKIVDDLVLRNNLH